GVESCWNVAPPLTVCHSSPGLKALPEGRGVNIQAIWLLSRARSTSFVDGRAGPTCDTQLFPPSDVVRNAVAPSVTPTAPPFMASRKSTAIRLAGETVAGSALCHAP